MPQFATDPAVLAETKTIKRRVKPAPRIAAPADDAALLAACETFHQLRAEALAAGEGANWRTLFAVKNSLYETEAHTPKGVAARDAVLFAPAPDFPLTGNAALDEVIQAARQAVDNETRTGVAHTFAEITLERGDPAIDAAEQPFIAAREAAEAGYDAILEPTVHTLAEARARLHAYLFGYALSQMHQHQWRPLSLDEASAVVAKDTYSASIVAAGMGQYLADVERLTCPLPPSPPSDWTAAVVKVEATYQAFEAIYERKDPAAPQAEIDAARDTFIAARDALFLIPAPDAAGLAYKIAEHPDLPALQEGKDLDWYAENGDHEERIWVSIIRDAKALAGRAVPVEQHSPSPTMAALSAEFERRWAMELACYDGPDHTDEQGDAATAATFAIVGKIKADPAVTWGDLQVIARTIVWGHGDIDQMRKDLGDSGSTYNDLTLALMNRLLVNDAPPAVQCDAAETLTAYRAAVEAGDDFDKQDGIATAACSVVASSISGALFQFSIAHHYLSLANEFDHCEGQERLFKLGRTALLNASLALSGITGVRMQEAGWDLNEYAKRPELV